MNYTTAAAILTLNKVIVVDEYYIIELSFFRFVAFEASGNWIEYSRLDITLEPY